MKKRNVGAGPVSAQNGITLIALIITIIVMMILVAVTVTFTIGENGILSQAKESAKLAERAQLHEQIMGAMKLTNEGKIIVGDSYDAAKATLEAQGYTVGELNEEDGTFEVTGEKGTYKYKITETEIIVKESSLLLTLNSDEDSIFTNEYYEVFGEKSDDPFIEAKLVYQSKEKTIIISNSRYGPESGTSKILVEYYENEELKKSFALRGKSICFNASGLHTEAYDLYRLSAYEHLPKRMVRPKYSRYMLEFSLWGDSGQRARCSFEGRKLSTIFWRMDN